MKTLVKEIDMGEGKLISPSVIQSNDEKIKVIDFYRLSRYHILQISINDIENDNYRIFLKGRYITLIISELREISMPMHIHNMNWNFENYHSYEVMKHVDILLPGDDFYLVRHYAILKKQVLIIVLGKINFN